jgi:hypothetical protein
VEVSGFGVWSVFDMAEHAAIVLAATPGYSSPALPFRATFWTFDQANILAQILSTPTKTHTPTGKIENRESGL